MREASSPWKRRVSSTTRALVRGASCGVLLASIDAGAASSIAIDLSTIASDHDARTHVRFAQNTTANEEYEVLRRLLGVPSPTPPPPAEPAPTEPAPAPSEVAPPPSAPPIEEVEKPQAAPKAKPAAAPKKPVVIKKPAPKPKPKAPPKPAAKPPVAKPEPAQEAASPKPSSPSASAPIQGTPDDLPAIGTIISAADIERWKHLLGPSIQWALNRGATIEVGAAKPIPLEDARAKATERYHSQVALNPSKTDMINYVAGMPFPFVTAQDPDAAVKIMFNQQARVVVDDIDVRNVSCKVGRLAQDSAMALERTYVIGHWRRLFYIGRLYQSPMPLWKSQDNVRYRENQHPLIEPFDLKSGGWSYTRYLDPTRPDDAWIYYPITRRVRRISTAQRSQGFFGQDMDLDSYTGFAGNPAWTEWELLGEKTILAPMHARNIPTQWQEGSADFMFDEVWEPRKVYVIAGRSRNSEYGFGTRVLYVDQESYLIPYSEIYDRQGALWKALLQAWAFRRIARADAGGAEFDLFYLPGYSMIDMQLDHVTRCELPMSNGPADSGWYYNYGPAEGTTEEIFDVSSFIEQAH